MGTKINPGDFDCYANAEPDEPMFVLLARDERAPIVVRQWVSISQNKRHADARKEGNASPLYSPKELEALACADAMEKWRKENRP